VSRVRDAIRTILDAVARPLVDEEWLPGLAVVLVDDAGETIWTHGVRRAGGPAVDADTQFELGAATTTFTALLLAQQAATGHLRLDEPLADLVPAGVEVPQRGPQMITLLHLATHYAGLPAAPRGLAGPDPLAPWAEVDEARLFQALAGLALPHETGAGHDPSSYGVALLGHAMARRAGRPFDELLADAVLRPLGMAATGFASPDPERLAQPHFDALTPAPLPALGAFAPAAGLRSTPHDLVRFLRAQLGVLAGDPPGLRAAIERSHEAVAPSGPTSKVTLGWSIPGGSGIRWTSGLTTGSYVFLGVDLATRRGVAVLANARGPRAEQLGFYLLRTWADEPRLPRAAAVADPAALDAYAGEYTLAEDFVLAIRREGARLVGQATGQPSFGLWPAGGELWAARAVEVALEFIRGDDGRVEGLVLLQAGARVRAPRRGPAN
jgi:CubicO group peptidase (beta-lactamase class C family)